MKKLLCAVALVGMLAAPSVVQGQAEAGPILAYHTDLEAIGIGAYLAVPLPQIGAGFALVPDFTWFFPDGGNYFEINADLGYFFPVAEDAPVIPFAFGGLNIARVDPDVGNGSTDVGLNLGGGVQFSGQLRPFAGAKFEIQDATGFVIFGGISFALGGGA